MILFHLLNAGIADEDLDFDGDKFLANADLRGTIGPVPTVDGRRCGIYGW